MKAERGFLRIVLADSHHIFRAGLRRILERQPDLRVIAEAADGLQAVRQVDAQNPDVLIIEEELLAAAGEMLLRSDSCRDGSLRILAIGSLGNIERIMGAFRMGARGFAPKEFPARVLIDGIRSVMEGKRWIGLQPARAGRPAAETSAENGSKKSFGLTKRELEIVHTVVGGYSNRAIAKKLKISEDTVKHHVTNIFDKTGVYNRLELALFAIHHGLHTAGTRLRQAV